MNSFLTHASLSLQIGSFANLVQASFQRTAQTSVERIVNAIPEGILIAGLAWLLLRVLRGQNSGTRFAVWFSALLTVAVLPVIGGLGLHRLAGAAGISSLHYGDAGAAAARPAISIPYGWALIVFALWGLGATIGLARLAVGFWNLRRLRRSCTPINLDVLDPQVRKTVEEIGSKLVATSDAVRVPTALGFGKKTIILPAWALRELSAEDLNAVLLHEFEHLRRGDDWTNLTQKIVKAVFFFHPAVWWIESRLSVEREMACDDAVLEKTSNAHGYATCLVSLLEKSLAHRLAPKPLSMAQAAIDRAREASLRLARILDANRPQATRVWKPALGMVGACSVICVALLTAAPQFVAFERSADHETIAGKVSANNVPANNVAVNNADATFVPRQNLIQASLRSTSPQGQSANSETVSAVSAMLRTEHTATTHQNPAISANARRLPARDAADLRLNQEIANQEIANERSIEQEFDRLMAVHALMERQFIPQLQPVVYVETRQVRMPDSSIWNVQVVRVVWVDRENGKVKVPVVNSL